MATKMSKNNTTKINKSNEENNDVKTVEESSIKTVEESKREFSPNDYILCHSVTAGGLNIVCRSGNYYQFRDYGAENEIEYRDLVSLIRKRSGHIFMPRIIIDDKDFLAQFKQVQDVYENMFTKKDLSEILSLPVDEMISTIKTVPQEVYPTLRSLISTKIANGEIDSVRKIRALSEYFNSDFNLISELFSN